MKTTNVLFIWQPREELKQYLRNGLSHLDCVRLIFPEDTKQETFLRHAPEADIIVGWRPNRPLLSTAKNLKLFINPGVGVQHLIELFRETTRECPITLVNGHGNTYFAAQHAVALLLALMNKIIPHHNWMKNGEWRKGDDHAISTPLRDRTVGLLGYGAVNQKVHKFLAGFDIDFAILRRILRKKQSMPTPARQYDVSQLNDFLAEIDTLIVAVPQTSQTVGLLKKKELAILGPQGLVVNVARGAVIDEKSLFYALKQGKIGGAALDVWYEYHPRSDPEGNKYPYKYPFHELDNVVLSPHRAASPFNDLKRWDEVIDNIERFTCGSDDFINVVDLEREY